MKNYKITFLIVLALLILTSCRSTSQPLSTLVNDHGFEKTVAPTLVPTADAVGENANKFPLTYVDAAAYIQISYPEGWTSSPREVIGDRGAQAALFSPGSSLEKIEEGGARITLITYKWDPKNDLNAFISQRKIAWESSGFSVTTEETFSFGENRVLEIFQIKTADNNQVLFAFTN